VISDLYISLGFRYFVGVVNERTSFAIVRERIYKCLTKKLRMFLSRLNEMSGGCEKIVPVSGSFWSNYNGFN